MLRHLKLIQNRSLPVFKQHQAVQTHQKNLQTHQLLNLTRKHFVTNSLIGNLVHGSSYSFWRKIVDVVNEAKRAIENQEHQPKIRTPSQWLKIIRGEAPVDYGRYTQENSDEMTFASNATKTPQELYEEHKYRKEVQDFIDARMKSVNLIQAKRLCDSNQLEEARQCVDLILQYDPKNADAYAVKAFVATKQFKNQEALTCLDNALEIDPTHRTALLGKGTIYLQLKENELALKYLEIVLEKYPASIPALINKACALIRLGRDEQALRIYETVISMDPQNEIAQENRARLFLRRKKAFENEQKKDLEQLKLKSSLRKESDKSNKSPNKV